MWTIQSVIEARYLKISYIDMWLHLDKFRFSDVQLAPPCSLVVTTGYTFLPETEKTGSSFVSHGGRVASDLMSHLPVDPLFWRPCSTTKQIRVSPRAPDERMRVTSEHGAGLH